MPVLYLSGIHMYDNDLWTEKHLVAAAEQVDEYPNSVVVIMVGNENVHHDNTGDYTADELIEYIETMYEYLKEKGRT
jgi:exo-beta-1,3-glucanase (GH17 family)